MESERKAMFVYTDFLSPSARNFIYDQRFRHFDFFCESADAAAALPTSHHHRVIVFISKMKAVQQQFYIRFRNEENNTDRKNSFSCTGDSNTSQFYPGVLLDCYKCQKISTSTNTGTWTTNKHAQLSSPQSSSSKLRPGNAQPAER